jgi:aldehyde:ferredoxin oxidoreductase
MLGGNLMISDLEGLLKEIFVSDDYGIDIISCGNVIGFLMEAYEKNYIDKKSLDGIDLKWGNVDATLKMINKIIKREGIGELASRGVKFLAEGIGKGSEKFAIHVKGQELAAWNVHADPPRSICYATANRGACHINGKDANEQNSRAIMDSLGLCLFAAGGYGMDLIPEFLSAITGREWTIQEFIKAGERIFNLEKMFNYREGFRREDDSLPARFFEEPLTIGPKKGAVLDREKFNKALDEYYKKRAWDPETTRPGDTKLNNLGLSFASVA